jgi:hypothetical protein
MLSPPELPQIASSPSSPLIASWPVNVTAYELAPGGMMLYPSTIVVGAGATASIGRSFRFWWYRSDSWGDIAATTSPR